jgi:hypothetical protein
MIQERHCSARFGIHAAVWLFRLVCALVAQTT